MRECACKVEIVKKDRERERKEGTKETLALKMDYLRWYSLQKISNITTRTKMLAEQSMFRQNSNISNEMVCALP